MQLPPPSVLATWPAPNYDNPVTRHNELLIITIILSPIAIFMIALRTYTRLRLSKAWGVDDILLLFSLPPTLAISVLTVLAVRSWGWDRHIWDVKPELVSEGLKLVIAMHCLFATAVSSYKLSLLILTRRIMVSGTGMLRHIAEVGMALVIAEWFIFQFAVIFTCRPVSAYWTLSTTPQDCINEKVHLLIAGIINTITDFLVFLLPLPTVLNLKIPKRQQIILTLVFGAGLVVCIAGTVRIWYTWKSTTTHDRTWESYGVWISSMVELYIGIICASIPACKPFFSRYLPSIIGSSFGGQSRDVQELIITGYTKPQTHNRNPSSSNSSCGYTYHNEASNSNFNPYCYLLPSFLSRSKRNREKLTSLRRPEHRRGNRYKQPVPEIAKMDAIVVTRSVVVPPNQHNHEYENGTNSWLEAGNLSESSLIGQEQRKSRTPRSKFAVEGGSDRGRTT